MITVIPKGYILEITSWENDGDHYNTKKYVVDNEEDAILIAKTAEELFASHNRSEIGVGNSDSSEYDRIVSYLESNPDLVKYLEIDDLKDEDEVEDIVSDFAGDLMGYSEYYTFRVCESVTIYYSPKEIKLKEIKIR